METLCKPGRFEAGRPGGPVKVGMISLGCAKNLVDAEIMLGGIRSRGMEITSDATEADVVIVNTCAFIDSAKEESIEAILQAHQERGLVKRGRQKLIVSGCMSQRFSKELAAELPEVDAFRRRGGWGLQPGGPAARLEELEDPVEAVRLVRPGDRVREGLWAGERAAGRR